MITMGSLLESTAPGFSGFKRRDVGQGYGGSAGSWLGKLAGGVAGAGIGHMIDVANNGEGVGVPGGIIGGMAGATLGGIPGSFLGRRVGENIISDPDKPMDERSRLQRIGILAKATSHPGAVTANALLPKNAGFIAANIYNGMKVSDRLGYGTLGRFGALGGPIIGGLFTPEKLDKKR